MSSRVRCSLEWEGARYLTNRQVVSAAGQIFRRYVGVYYRKVKAPEIPLWKYLSEMWESIPELPESARLKIWREKRGVGRKKIPVPVNPARMREQQVAPEVRPIRTIPRYTTGAAQTIRGATTTGTVTTAPMQTGTANQLFHWDNR